MTEEQARERLMWVEHTHEVIFECESLLGYLRDAETGQRGYLLTKNPVYLEPYNSGVMNAEEAFLRLKELTRDNTEQQKRLERIAVLMEEKFSELAETLRYAGKADWEKAVEVVKGDIGKKLMDNIRLCIETFEYEERKLLAQRKQSFAAKQAALRSVFWGGGGAVALCAVLALSYVKRRILRPLETLTESINRVSRGYDEALDIPVESRDEIGLLVEAFKKMRSEIQRKSSALVRLSGELKEQRDKALQASVTDPLTGLYNRRKFEEVCAKEAGRMHRNNELFCMAIFDVDDFKNINDVYGHARGDEVLKEVAQCLKDLFQRSSDYVFRIGGEEFVLITTTQDAVAIRGYVEATRQEIESRRIPNKGGRVGDFLTVSVGMVIQPPNCEATCSDLLKRADKYLYLAKKRGRNRVVGEEDCESDSSSVLLSS